MDGEPGGRRGERRGRASLARIVRFFLSGTSAAAVQLALFYLFTDLLGVWYLAATTLAFVLGFFVGFVLQKYWTFNITHTALVGRELALYAGAGVINLGVNAGAMYLLVDRLHVWHMAAQVIVSGALAALSFLLYRSVIFIPTSTEP
ncbi:MAG: GtrA family protein [Deltaproteobacteria bacterium]|nr:GtrA family protein [Deltaproteobacteria bacterium]NCP95628.1 GtrA family protein [Deltaproteobacteria bacterium]NCS73557.1 GtrA family protein [Deltaproteobacteria bacterium]HBB41449.1 hypothetical protein [Pseudomonadota bacterium]